jgi:hypothetical protein
MTNAPSPQSPASARERHISTRASHFLSVSLLVTVAIWIMRRFILTSELPAGTDMFGFISRASQYSSFGRLYDAWSSDSFGSRRVFNFDNIVGALTLLARNPVLTVKILDALTLFGAGLAAYILTWSWYERRLAATIAGLLYMSSQASLTQWGSGHLNVEIIIALAPLMLLTWSLCLEYFTLRRAVAFTFAVGVDFLVRADLALYIAPFLLFYTISALARRGRSRTTLINATWTLTVAVPGILLLNSAWLVPFLDEYRVGYETLNQIFTITSLSSRSLDFYSSVLGFGREIGYFAFTGAETWFSYPWLSMWAYYAFASIIPILAYSALWWRRDRLTVFLALAAVLATLAAPGTRPPLGELYLWAANNVPVFGNLRDPTRWLVVQGLAYALLAALAIDYIVAAVASRLLPYRSRQYLSWLHTSAIRCGLALILAVAGLVPVLPTFVIGLRAWHVTQPQLALLDRVRDASGQGMVASIPFDQDYQFLVQGSYQGYEHDLGYESVMYTGREDVADGSWNQRSANFVTYEANLLDEGDPAFSSMLSSAGVSQLISFHYPLVTAQPTSLSVGPYSQQATAAKLSNLTPELANSAGTDYSINEAAPPLSLRQDVAVVLGGDQGAAALADQPGFKLSDWAVLTADDIIATRGYSALLALIRQANLVLLADERPLDIAVEGANPLLDFGGITSDPQLSRAQTNVPSDQSAETGSLNDVELPIPQPRSISTSSALSVRTSKRVEIWARVLAEPQAATIQARVDGKLVGAITPVTLGTGGFEWLRVAATNVDAGKHRITLSAVPSTFGDNYEVDETRVLEPTTLAVAESQLNETLASQASRVAYAFDLNEVAKWSWASVPKLIGPDTRYHSFPQHTWTAPLGADTAVSSTTAPGGATAPQFTARAGRSVYTVAKINYSKPQNWAGRPYIYLKFDGHDSGNAYQMVFDFGTGAKDEALYTFSDDFRGWKALAFATANPGQGSGKTDWSHVDSVRIALPSKSEAGTFALSVPLPSNLIYYVGVPLPVLPGAKNFKAAASQAACADGARINAPRWNTSSRTLVLPVASMSPTCRMYVNARAGYRQQPATAVSFRRTGTESWSYSFTARHLGILVWTQAYDPLWKLSGVSGTGAPLPILSLLNGYSVGPGLHTGTISFAGESSAIVGVLVTVLSLILLLLTAVLSRRRGRHLRSTTPSEYVGPEYQSLLLQRASQVCLTLGTALLVACPVASSVERVEVLLPLSFAAVLAFGASAILAVRNGTRSSSFKPDSVSATKSESYMVPRAYREVGDMQAPHSYPVFENAVILRGINRTNGTRPR